MSLSVFKATNTTVSVKISENLQHLELQQVLVHSQTMSAAPDPGGDVQEQEQSSVHVEIYMTYITLTQKPGL